MFCVQLSVKMDARMVGVASAPTDVLVSMDSRGHSVREVRGDKRLGDFCLQSLFCNAPTMYSCFLPFCGSYFNELYFFYVPGVRIVKIGAALSEPEAFSDFHHDDLSLRSHFRSNSFRVMLTD